MTDEPTHRFDTELWRWTPDPPAKGSWHFVTISGDAADAVRALGFERRALGGARGFGAVRLRVSVEGVAFETSAFPQSGGDGYLLPVKAEVRKRAGAAEGDVVTVAIWA
ncbi:DUF1905 domain-containing protein [Sphingomonas canadensis]|uniref:DUF1905 domain-containing protein n=1 Tax=Sphingomonas canadensis TaxID=1219257 RepID=A0ABW3HFI9_9SPHN|nr:DUF1905 domain-containing protein [Sphingomonas canadensis]MCW3838207.1 DUF1905 domain-containing protein [Sphingomonas canadensis]